MAATAELLNHMDTRGYRPALLAFINREGNVQVATSCGIDLRHFVEYLFDTWLDAPNGDESREFFGH